MNLVAISGLFKQFNYLCDMGVDGQEAIDAITKRADSANKDKMYKLVMLDFSMPVCNGPTAAKAIRDLLTEKGYSRDH